MKNNESEMRNYSNFDTNIDRDPIYSFSFILLAYIQKKKKNDSFLAALWAKPVSYTRHFLPLFSDYFNWVV